MIYTSRVIATAIAGTIALGPGSTTASAQLTVDLENKYSNVGVIMVWRVDSAGKPVELRGFASGTLIRDRVMVTAGHFTAPATSLGTLPASIRIFASFSATDAKDPETWIPVVRQATHPSMPHCPPPPQCDPTDDSLVAPLEPGVAGVPRARAAWLKTGALRRTRHARQIRRCTNDHRGIWHHCATAACTAGQRSVGWKASHQNLDTATSRRRDLGAVVHTQLRVLRRLRWCHFSSS